MEETGSCPVCLELYREPKMLACGHSMCRHCTDKLIADATPLHLRRAFHLQGARTDNVEISCPMCRVKTRVPPQGLPTNFSLQEVLRRFSELGTRKEERPWKLCPSCQTQLPDQGFFHCEDCADAPAWLCASCGLRYHNGHHLLGLVEVKDRRDAVRLRLDRLVTDSELRLQEFTASSAHFQTLIGEVSGAIREKTRRESAAISESLDRAESEVGVLSSASRRVDAVQSRVVRAAAALRTAVAEAEVRLRSGYNSVLEELSAPDPPEEPMERGKESGGAKRPFPLPEPAPGTSTTQPYSSTFHCHPSAPYCFWSPPPHHPKNSRPPGQTISPINTATISLSPVIAH